MELNKMRDSTVIVFSLSGLTFSLSSHEGLNPKSYHSVHCRPVAGFINCFCWIQAPESHIINSICSSNVGLLTLCLWLALFLCAPFQISLNGSFSWLLQTYLYYIKGLYLIPLQTKHCNYKLYVATNVNIKLKNKTTWKKYKPAFSSYNESVVPWCSLNSLASLVSVRDTYWASAVLPPIYSYFCFSILTDCCLTFVNSMEMRLIDLPIELNHVVLQNVAGSAHLFMEMFSVCR